MGELLRRYWHPVGLAARRRRDAAPGARARRRPDPVSRRRRPRRAGPSALRASRRLALLRPGRGRGIRCCYHGWLFDVSTATASTSRASPTAARCSGNVRQPWYPLEERYGLVFAYLGPPDRKPLLPRYRRARRSSTPGEFTRGRRLEHRRRRAADHSVQLAAALRERGRPLPRADPARRLLSGHQFVPAMAQMPKVEWSTTERGVRVESAGARSTTASASGASPRRRCRRCASCRARAWAGTARSNRSAGCCRSTTRTSASTSPAGSSEPGDIGRMRSKMNGKFWWELSDAEHRDFPGDYEAQVSQGAIALAFGRAPAHQRPRRRACCAASCASSCAASPTAPIRPESPAARRSDAALRPLRQLHRMKVLLVTQPMPASAFIAAIHARAPELELVEYRSALSDAELADVDVVLGWQMPPGLPARLPRAALGLLGRRRRREAARSRPRAARSRLAHRRPRAGRGDRPVRRHDGAAPRARRSSATRRSSASATGRASRSPMARHRVAVLGTGAMGGEIAAWLERCGLRRARLEPALGRDASRRCSRRARSSSARCRSPPRPKASSTRARSRRCRVAPTSSTSRAARTSSSPT